MIEGVTFHPRSAWEPTGFRMASDFDRTPPAYVAANVTRGAVHYSAAMNLPDGDLGEFDHQIGPWLAAVTRDYLANRSSPPGYVRLSDGRVFPGYPIGYSFAIDWLGGVWELRGFDYRPAATNGHNHYTIALLMLSDRFDPSSELACASARAVLREARRRSGRSDFANRPLGHGEFHTVTGIGTPTACPGAANLAQIHDGMYDLDFDEGATMGALTALRPAAKRAFDSRPAAPIDAEFQAVNGALPRVPLKAGDKIRIVAGLATQAAVHITAVRRAGAGFLSLSSDGVTPLSSKVNFDQVDGVESNGGIVALTDGSFWVHCGGSPDALVDVVVDIEARG